MHRRKSSKEDVDDGDTFVLIPDDEPTTAPTLTAAPGRHRVPALPQLGPGIPARQPPVRRPPSISLNSPPSSPFRASHARVRSISSGPFVPPVSSPLANTFHVPLHPFEPDSSNDAADGGRGHGRRHSRMHSRNLSIFFPRPHATISEDLPSDVESAPNNRSQSQIDLHIPVSQSEPLQIGHDRTASFSFGSSGTMPKSDSTGAVPAGVTARRGHHHKHSLSHNFFSFLDPSRQSQPEAKPEELHTAPTPAPMSPWSPVSNIQGGESVSSSNADLTTGTSSRSNSASPAPSPSPSQTNFSWNLSKNGNLARVACVLQFCLGALVWVRGQAIGSLACTGLGYWVVFDAFGIAVGGPLLGMGKGGFGPARTQTTLLFAQCVYLMFAGVYVAKEAVEHILLSAGHGHGHGRPSPSPSSTASSITRNASTLALNAAGGITRGLGLHGAGEMGNDGHHHHRGDERPDMLGLRYPLGLIIIVLLSLLVTSFVFEQHDVLVKITNKHIHLPSPFSLFQRSRLPSFPASSLSDRQAPWERILRNPYALPPILFCVAILGGEIVLNVAHYTPFDLSLATLQVIITTRVAYTACIVLGGVLLQTAPAASFSMSAGGISGIGKGANSRGIGAKSMTSAKGTNTLETKMESFWHVVREIERHEHVTSLPAPHVWQVCPPGQTSFGQGETRSSVSRSASRSASRGFASALRSAFSPSDSFPFFDAVRGPDAATEPQLMITLSPHVRSSLRDEEVLKFTRWACERVRGAFVGDGARGHGMEVEVCVGVLRG
ncbi:hypothetical protein DEU56DRAFT_804990 [Suillus clintonianus]|uniref:uncharacterized protein n=1 Tax=Suillus clintonianus TaxID=1904413 RepID=UPI001B87C23B|nr:uncharacterized protein DEU56DRAFT_804990 [Suillus clintonianus]KAG2136635.1 hypothetical protein DEU56DRAFT_804990 [Suillus clintonianus]